MSAVLEQVQHRCTRCFRSLTADVADIGTEQPCEFCGHLLIVPAIAGEAEEFAAAASYMPAKLRSGERVFGSPADVNWSPRCDYANGDMLAPLWKRFVGSVVDNGLMVVAILAGLAIVSALISQGLIDRHALKAKQFNIDLINAQAILYFPLAILLLTQWNLIASRGQSLGKLLLGMRIVGREGENPGFLRAVVLRNWLRFALSFVPFFSFVDWVVIFGTSRRCLHDYFGGTFVIENH